MGRRLSIRRARRSGWYYFCEVTKLNGKSILVADGPFGNETDATDAAYKIRDANKEPIVKHFDTGDLRVAKNIYRHQLSQETGYLAPVLEPMRSTKTARKWKYGNSDEEEKIY